MCAQWVAKDQSFLHADSEDSGCPDWSESSLGTQPHCWFCHEVAHFGCLFEASVNCTLCCIPLYFHFFISDFREHPHFNWNSADKQYWLLMQRRYLVQVPVQLPVLQGLSVDSSVHIVLLMLTISCWEFEPWDRRTSRQSRWLGFQIETGIYLLNLSTNTVA